MTFADLKAGVQALAPNQLDDTTAGNIVNRAYLSILRKRFWTGLRLSTVLSTQANKTAGQVTLTFGSAAVVGIGTPFAATDAGRYLLMAGYEPVRILSSSGALALTLAQAWQGPTLTAQGYTILSLRYPMPVGAERVLRLRALNWPLSRSSLSMIDQFDPQRRWQGDPFFYTEAEFVSGVMELELWPVPNVRSFLWLVVRATPAALVAGTDVPVIPPEPVLHRAQAEASRVLLARTGEGLWSGEADKYEMLAGESYDAAARQDRTMYGAQQVAMDSDSVFIPDLSQLSWARAAQAIYQKF